MPFYSSGAFQAGSRLFDGTQLNAEESSPQFSVEAPAAATGTTVADAYELKAMVTYLATVPGGSGVMLPSAVPGLMRVIFNADINALTVYPRGADVIDLAASVPLTGGLRCMYFCVFPGVWISAQMGAVSA